MSGMKRVPFLIGVCSVGILAVAFYLWSAAAKPESKLAPALVQTSTTQPTQKPVKATATFVPSNDATDLLGLMMWQFDVKIPQSERNLEFVLELREKGKATQRLASTGYYDRSTPPADGHLKIFVGIHPLSGMMSESEKVKYMVRINQYRSFDKVTVGSTSSPVVEPNAFNGYQKIASSGPLAQQKDGSFVLVSGNRKSNSSQKTAPDIELVFVVNSNS